MGNNYFDEPVGSSVSVEDDVPDQYVSTRIDVNGLKDAVNIVDVIRMFPAIGEIVPATQDVWKGVDPNNDESGHPSVRVYVREGRIAHYSQSWYGDHISYLERFYGMSFWRAIETLQGIANGRTFEVPSVSHKKAAVEAKPDIPPPPSLEEAGKFNDALFEDKEALCWVADKWHLGPDDIAANNIGVGHFWVRYNKEVAIREKAITFPIMVNGSLHNIRYRIMNPYDPKRRYGFMVQGRSNYPVGLDEMETDHVILCEGEAKRITIRRLLPKISVVGLCGMGNLYPNELKGGESAAEFISRFVGKTVFVALDGGQHPYYHGIKREDGTVDKHPRSWVVDLINAGVDMRGIVLPGQADDFILQPGGTNAFLRMLHMAERLNSYAEKMPTLEKAARPLPKLKTVVVQS